MSKDYQEGRVLGEIVMLLADNYRQSGGLPGFDIKDIQEYERAKEKLCLKVINTDLNRKLLSDFAGRIGGDFYIIPSSIHELLFRIFCYFLAETGTLVRRTMVSGLGPAVWPKRVSFGI